MAFSARLFVLGIVDCPALFFHQFSHILEPPGEVPAYGVKLNDLVMIADYFRIAGAWMRARFGVVPYTSIYLVRDLTYNELRWETWKRNLRRLIEYNNTKGRAAVNDILGILDRIY